MKNAEGKLEKEKEENILKRKICMRRRKRRKIFGEEKYFFFAEDILQRQEVFTDLKIEEMESFILQILTVLPLFLMVSFVQSIGHIKP